MDNEVLSFGTPSDSQTLIKVIGVGGGGGNAVTNMYNEGIKDVSFVLCNTDNQALLKSNVPNKLLLGRDTTGGLGSGNVPEKGEKAAVESQEEIKSMLNDGTKMTFITAGMGGGTGTGAGPIVAKISKEMGILTVGIVTIPFLFEGRPKIVKAVKGVRRMADNVDSLLVINNERLRTLYSEARTTVPDAYRKADETLTIAARSIAEIITTNLEQNVDFADVDFTMRNSGVGLISVGYGEGEGRLQRAIEDAVNSTLVNDVENIYNAQRVAFVIYYSHENALRIDEMDDIHNFMARFKTEYEVKWGHGYDDSLGDRIKITILVTGFGLGDVLTDDQQTEISEEDRLRKAQEEQEKKLARDAEDKLIDTYYGTFGIRFRPRVEPVVLTSRELESDDDSLIRLLESTPAFNRDPKDVARLRGTHNPVASESRTKKPTGTVIHFG